MQQRAGNRRVAAAAAAFALAATAALAGMYFYRRRRRCQALADYKRLAFAAAEAAPVVASDAEFALRWRDFERSARRLGFCGLDCEWHWRNELGEAGPLALLQLAAADGAALLIRVQKLREVPKELVEFLGDERLLKFGVAIEGDVRQIADGIGVATRGVVDLRHLVTALGWRPRRLGLKQLAIEFVGVDYTRLRAEARSNWEAPELSDAQRLYAALDALAGALIPLRLCRQGDCLRVALRHWDAEELRRWCRGIVDVTFSRAAPVAAGVRSPTTPLSSSSASSSSLAVRRNPLYHNCRMLAPDDELLCTLDRRKADWYVERNMAEVLAAEPFTIRLKFEPRGRPSEGQEYYLADKANCCVVCGRAGGLQRRKVVPDEYRRHFPEFLKSHKSHDVVLLCTGCHEECGRHAERLKRRLAADHDAPTSNRLPATPDARQLRQAKSCAKALVMHASGKAAIPEARRLELRRCAMQFLEVDDVSEADLKELLDASELGDDRRAAEKHGAKVVRAVLDAGRILEFERMWREEFLRTMQPRHLPPHWSPDHQHAAMQPAVDEFLAAGRPAA